MHSLCLIVPGCAQTMSPDTSRQCRLMRLWAIECSLAALPQHQGFGRLGWRTTRRLIVSRFDGTTDDRYECSIAVPELGQR